MRFRSTTRRPAGFTLVELAIVILIIGLLTSFLLVTSYEGVRRANERATQALILKLDTAMADRMDALMTIRPPVTNAHRYLAMTLVPQGGSPPVMLNSEERAAVIAQVDYLRMEVPDVFFVQDDDDDPSTQFDYPLNFACMPYLPGALGPVPGGLVVTAPGVNANLAPYATSVMPLGNALQLNAHYQLDSSLPDFRKFVSANSDPASPAKPEILGEVQWNKWPGPPVGSPVAFTPAGQGIFGASYAIAGGFYKQLGYGPRGYNVLDDDGDGLIDERDEGNLGLTAPEIAAIDERLLSHRHETARSEALYALLVEGQGPLGSIFTTEDFTDREIGDTDGDGLMEFIDAWGEPLQFYRWPVYFVSDLGTGRSFQKGASPYGGPTEDREQNPLDPNQALVAPAWWADLAALGSANPPSDSTLMGPRARTFQRHYFSLLDPRADDPPPPSGGPPPGYFWDRSAFFKRRAYFTKFLIASSGPDLRPGIAQFDFDYFELVPSGASYGVSVYGVDQFAQVTPVPAARNLGVVEGLNLVESQAGRFDPVERTSQANAGGAGLFQGLGSGSLSGRLQSEWATDDITNHTIGSAASGVR